MKSLKKIILLIAFVATSLTLSAKTDVNDVMSRTVNTLTSKGSLSASFNIYTDVANKTQGQIKVSGKKYLFTSAVNNVIFNGKTQWNIDKQTKEVNIYQPDNDEIAQTNPFAIISAYKTAYKSKLLSSSSSSYKVELTPTSNAQSLKKVVVTINAASMLPTKVVMTLTDGNTLQIDITDIKTGVNISSSNFVFKKSSYPGYEIVDLR